MYVGAYAGVGFFPVGDVASDMTWESLFDRADEYETTETAVIEALRARRGDDA